MIDLLRAKKLLVTHGTGFNWPEPDHFRLVTLPDAEVLEEAIGRIVGRREFFWEDLVEGMDVRFRGGRRHHYSNVGYAALGELLARSHGRPWHERPGLRHQRDTRGGVGDSGGRLDRGG